MLPSRALLEHRQGAARLRSP